MRAEKINTKLALCIPAYNAEKFLPTLLSSAKKQLIPFDEILVYNDCSTDSTSAVAREFGATVIEGVTNMGCSFAKNQLASATACDWIHFHDADDDMSEHFTSFAHEWMDKSNTPDVVLFDYEYRDFLTKELLGIRKFNNTELQDDPIRYTIKEQINPFCGLYRRTSFLNAGGYDIDPRVLYNEDVALHCRLAINGLRFASEERVAIINYRVTTSMSSANRPKTVVAQYEVMKKVAAQVDAKYYAEISKKLWQYCRHAAFYNDWELVKHIVNLSKNLGNRISNSDSALFTAATLVNPYWAIYLREHFNRVTRKNYKNNPLW